MVTWENPLFLPTQSMKTVLGVNTLETLKYAVKSSTVGPKWVHWFVWQTNVLKVINAWKLKQEEKLSLFLDR